MVLEPPHLAGRSATELGRIEQYAVVAALAPHLGSATRETRTAMAMLAVENVLAVLDGRPPLTPV